VRGNLPNGDSCVEKTRCVPAAEAARRCPSLQRKLQNLPHEKVDIRSNLKREGSTRKAPAYRITAERCAFCLWNDSERIENLRLTGFLPIKGCTAYGIRLQLKFWYQCGKGLHGTRSINPEGSAHQLYTVYDMEGDGIYPLTRKFFQHSEAQCFSLWSTNVDGHLT
jgi:hypothetical protein